MVGLSLNRGASLKPPGDVVRVHTLNRGADEVMEVVAAMERAARQRIGANAKARQEAEHAERMMERLEAAQEGAY